MDNWQHKKALFDNQKNIYVDESQKAAPNNKKARKHRGYARVKVIGVGGGGCNVISTMINFGMMGVEFWVCNTDMQALEYSKCENRVILGFEITKGLGAGANPEIGHQAAIESEAELKNIIKDADMIFIASGMGGGTGTGAAHVVAKIAQDLNILTVACVTKPFRFEGPIRMRNAEDGITMLRKHVDSLIIISNERLLEVIGDISFKDAFIESDKILLQAVQAITDLIAIPAQINLDFADIKTIMEKKGVAMIGVGESSGENRAEKAAMAAISCSLLDMRISGAKNALVNITSSSITLNEARTAVNIIKKSANSDIDVIYGMAVNKTLKDQIVVTVIATGFDNQDLNCFDSENMNYTDEDGIYDNDSNGKGHFTREENLKAPLFWTREQKKKAKEVRTTKSWNDNVVGYDDYNSTVQQQKKEHSNVQQWRNQSQEKYEKIRKNRFSDPQKSPEKAPIGRQNLSNHSFTRQMNFQEELVKRGLDNEKLWTQDRNKPKPRVNNHKKNNNVAEQRQSTQNYDEIPSFMVGSQKKKWPTR